MPAPLWIYLMALLYFTKVTTCSAISDAFDSVSHDQLTRMLQGTWSGHTLLNLALRALFTVAGGYLIVDDTVVAKPAARLLGEAAWVWSNQDRKVLFGVSVVLLVWTDGQHRVPLAFRVWHKGGVSKYELALELLSYARNRLKCKPLIMIEASPAAYPGGMLALGKSHSRTRRRPQCDSTPISTLFTAVSTCMPGVCMSAS